MTHPDPVQATSPQPLRLAYADRYADELSISLAGEHLVCADLLRHGITAFMTEQRCAYDVVADCEGRLLRLQVKATVAPRRFLQAKQTHITGYSWGIRRGKHGVRSYAEGEVDGFALVALDSFRVAYLKPQDAKQTIQIPTEGATSPTIKRFEDYSLARFLA